MGSISLLISLRVFEFANTRKEASEVVRIEAGPEIAHGIVVEIQWKQLPP